MATKNELVEGSRRAILVAAGCAFGTAFLVTGSLPMTSLLFCTLVAIIAGVLAMLSALNYDIGVIEGLALTVLIGLSFDHVLHVVEGFLLSGMQRGIYGLPMKYYCAK